MDGAAAGKREHHVELVGVVLLELVALHIAQVRSRSLV